jgi:hypothetical protein
MVTVFRLHDILGKSKNLGNESLKKIKLTDQDCEKDPKEEEISIFFFFLIKGARDFFGRKGDRRGG